MGLIECVNHQVMLSYDIMTEKEGEYVAQYFTTFAITKNGIVKFTSPTFDPELYKTEKEIKDEEITTLISQPLKAAAKKRRARRLLLMELHPHKCSIEFLYQNFN